MEKARYAPRPNRFRLYVYGGTVWHERAPGYQLLLQKIMQIGDRATLETGIDLRSFHPGEF